MVGSNISRFVCYSETIFIKYCSLYYFSRANATKRETTRCDITYSYRLTFYSNEHGIYVCKLVFQIYYSIQVIGSL